jgi:pyruvate,water dikinase
MAFFGDHPDVPPYVPHPDDERPDLLPRIGAHLEWLMSASSFPEMDADKADTIRLRAERPDLTTLDDAGLLARARQIQPLLVLLFDRHTITSSGSGVAPGILFAVGQAIGDATVPMKILAGLGDVDSAEPSYRLWELSRMIGASPQLAAAFDLGIGDVLDRLGKDTSPDAAAFMAAWQAFIADFGARGPNEYEISADTWETDPVLALASLDRVRHQVDEERPEVRNERRAAERAAVTEQVRAKLAAFGDEELAGQFEAAVVAGNQLAFRERTKTNLIRAVHEARMVFRELGRRHAEAGHLDDASHVFQLLDTELEAFVADPASFRETLAERAREWAELAELEPPFIIRDGNVPPLSSWSRSSSAGAGAPVAVGDVLQGVAGCPGVVTGTARVVLDIRDPATLEPGEILVAPLTDPGWAPLFMSAGGVVVDVGGQISHAVIVSRELGLPCVVSATNATSRIPNGARIEVDGDNGVVRILELP